MLDGIDAIHREALRRLVRLFKEGVLEQVVTDPAIHTLMELYDLLPAASASAAAPAATRRFPTIPIRAATPPAPVRHPHWVPVLACGDDLPAGSTRPVQADDTPLLLARRGDQFYALTGRCAVDGAPLAGATLDGNTLTCPRHAGCHYDVRTGQRLGGAPRSSAIRCASATTGACSPGWTWTSGRTCRASDDGRSPARPGLRRRQRAAWGRRVRRRAGVAPAKACAPPNVTVIETGIGGIGLVQELLRGYGALLLLDAHAAGQASGTVRLLTPVLPDLSSMDPHQLRDYFADSHYATPHRGRPGFKP